MPPRYAGRAGDIRFCLDFEREALSIPVMRRVLGDTLSRLGVDEDSIRDLLLAVTEACTNVLRHAGPGRRYEIVVRVRRNRCEMQVLDNGRGFDPAAVRRALRRPPRRPPTLRRPQASPARLTSAQLPESGRGLSIMAACVDDVTLRTRPGHGTVVSLNKRIARRAAQPPTRQPASALRDAG